MSKIQKFVKEVRLNYPILASLSFRYIKGQYNSSFLGYLWYLLNPLTLAISYYIAFVNILNYSLDNYLIYLMSGLFATVFFLHGIIGGSMAVVNESALIEKMNIPRVIIPLAFTISKFVMFITSEVIVIILLVLTGYGLTLNLLFLPFFISLQFVFMSGVIFILSSITVYVRDLGNMLSYMGMILSWITPTAYLPGDTSGLLSIVIQLNPMTYFMNCYHDIIYYKVIPNIGDVVVCVFVSVIFFIIGWSIFSKLKNNFAEAI